MTGSSTGSAGRAGRGPGAGRAAFSSGACWMDAAPLLEPLMVAEPQALPLDAGVDLVEQAVLVIYFGD
jgi:hypothetical protein